MLSLKTVVTTADGTIIEFSDWLSKFVVAHPKTSAFVALLIGILIGHLR